MECDPGSSLKPGYNWMIFFINRRHLCWHIPMAGLPIRRTRFIFGFITGQLGGALWLSSCCSQPLVRLWGVFLLRMWLENGCVIGLCFELATRRVAIFVAQPIQHPTGAELRVDPAMPDNSFWNIEDWLWKSQNYSVWSAGLTAFEWQVFHIEQALHHPVSLKLFPGHKVNAWCLDFSKIEKFYWNRWLSW